MSHPPIDYASAPKHGPTVLRALWRMRRLAVALVIVLVIYVGSYAGVSAFGEFHPGVIGSGGIKWYCWVPAGFSRGFRLRKPLFYAYLPLYRLDVTYWHRFGDAYGGRYPVVTPATRQEWDEWEAK